jgi:hypothetical protein
MKKVLKAAILGIFGFVTSCFSAGNGKVMQQIEARYNPTAERAYSVEGSGVGSADQVRQSAIDMMTTLWAKAQEFAQGNASDQFVIKNEIRLIKKSFSSLTERAFRLYSVDLYQLWSTRDGEALGQRMREILGDEW